MPGKGFHRIRHYGLFASSNRTTNIARARELLGAPPPVVELEEEKATAPDEPRVLPCPCPHCGGRMIVIDVFERGCEPTYRPALAPVFGRSERMKSRDVRQKPMGPRAMSMLSMLLGEFYGSQCGVTSFVDSTR